MPQLSSQKQQPLVIAFFAILVLVGGILYRNYFQPAPQASAPDQFSYSTLSVAVQIPQDLFGNDTFLKLQTYQPVAAPEPSLRPNPFVAP